MTDEMKLLRAFIEASGFDVETIRSLGPKTTFTGQQYTLPDGDGLCRQVIGSDYKVTKKPVIDDYVIIGELGSTLAYYIEAINEMNDLHPLCNRRLEGLLFSKAAAEAVVSSKHFRVVERIKGGYKFDGVKVVYENI